jgi:HAD superfamily hydrolase (TIGR01490 family)
MSLGAQRAAAFFDLDKTVIARASMVAFGGPLYRGGLLDRRTLLRAMFGQLLYLQFGASEEKLARIRESVLRLVKGWERERVAAIVGEALERIAEPIVYAEAADLIEQHRREGRLVVIVSASPEEIVLPLGRYLGADRTIATRAALDAAGRYTGEITFYAYGPHKADAMRALAAEEGIDLGASFAYSDSATDLPMLEAVGHPVAVNPDRALLRVARERGYEVLHFVRPIRLRDRVRLPPPLPVATATAGAALLAALLLAWRAASHRPPSGALALSSRAASSPPRDRERQGPRPRGASSP